MKTLTAVLLLTAAFILPAAWAYMPMSQLQNACMSHDHASISREHVQDLPHAAEQQHICLLKLEQKPASNVQWR